MENEDFRIGDVIVEIGEVEKLIVVCVSFGHYWTLRYPYDEREMTWFPEGVKMRKELVNRDFVKVERAVRM